LDRPRDIAQLGAMELVQLEAAEVELVGLATD
jgi:hypothetical protein